MPKVMRWTFWHDIVYPETDWPISDEKEQEYIDAIIASIRKHGYRITGFAHQGEQFCTPVFDDGKRYTASYRQWGQIMADALGIKREYAYTEWAWFPPEENEKLPMPTDWDDDEETRKQQARRWEMEQERQKQKLMAELESMKRFEHSTEKT